MAAARAVDVHVRICSRDPLVRRAYRGASFRRESASPYLRQL